jgi:hypothetical protein
MSNQNNVKKQKRLTIEELRNCKGFEHLSDDQAKETIKTLETLSILFYELYKKEEQKESNRKKIPIERIELPSDEDDLTKTKINKRIKRDNDEGKENIKKRNVA